MPWSSAFQRPASAAASPTATLMSQVASQARATRLNLGSIVGPAISAPSSPLRPGSRLRRRRRASSERRKPHGDPSIERRLRILPGRVRRARGYARQYLHPLVHAVDRNHAETAGGRGLRHVLAQHQVLHVGRRYQYTLLAGQTPLLANVEEALDLLVDAADRLDAAVLIDRASDGKGLADRRLRKRREQREELRRRRAIALDAAVGLLEDQARCERERALAPEPPAQEAREDEHALGMDRTTERHLALDVDHLALAEAHLRGDAARMAKAHAAQADDGEAVHLADPLALGLDPDRVAADLLLETPIDPVGAPAPRDDRGLDLGGADHCLAPGTCEVVGLLEQIREVAELGRELLGVAAHARRLVDHARHRAPVERAQFHAPCRRRDQACVKRDVLG